MKSERIVLIAVMVAVAVFAVITGYVSLMQGPPLIEIAKFKEGNPLASDVTVTDVFQVKEEPWSIDLASSTTFLGWSLEVELYREGSDNPLCSLRGKWDVLLDRVVWELGPQNNGGNLHGPLRVSTGSPSRPVLPEDTVDENHVDHRYL